MTAKDKATLMREMRQRRERDGLVRMDVWVPRELVKKVRAYVARLTQKAKRSD